MKRIKTAPAFLVAGLLALGCCPLLAATNMQTEQPVSASAETSTTAFEVIPASDIAEEIAAEPAPVSPPGENVPTPVPRAQPVTPTAATPTEEVVRIELDQENTEGVQVDVSERRPELISINLDGVPLQEVIRMFTRVSGANIVAGTELQGKVTVSLKDVEWEPALRVILESVDMALVQKSPGIYSVLSKKDLASEPLAIETVMLQYTTVTNVLPVIKQMLVSTNASVAGFPAANALIIQEAASRLAQIRQVIGRIDQPRPQVVIEAKFVELNDEAIKDLGINWQVLQGYTLSVTPSYGYQKDRVKQEGTSTTSSQRSTAQDSVTRQNLVQDAYVNYGTTADTDYGQQYDSSVDGSENQNGSSSDSVNYNGSANSSYTDTAGLVPGTPSTEYGSSSESLSQSESQNGSSSASSSSSASESGRASSQSSGQSSGSLSANGQNFTSFDAAQGTLTTVPTLEHVQFNENYSEIASDSLSSLFTTTEELLTAIMTADEFSLTLSALKQNTGVEIVSNPKILVANGEVATIHVGEERPYPRKSTTQNGTGGASTQSEIETKKIGVSIKVAPTVNSISNITLRIEPTLSRVLGTTTIDGNALPILSSRSIASEFSVDSGKTVAIGGLTQTRDEEVVNKIPLLGDIPVIGKYLFSHTHTDKIQDEIIIFVTVAMASAGQLRDVTGVPAEGRLIHRHLAQRAARAASLAAEMAAATNAAAQASLQTEKTDADEKADDGSKKKKTITRRH